MTVTLVKTIPNVLTHSLFIHLIQGRFQLEQYNKGGAQQENQLEDVPKQNKQGTIKYYTQF